jgi:CRISPR system Cascade subunit CasC
MADFLQLHMLTAYPPANLNRDDTGRPKTAVVGGVERLRISSQSLKRAWRTSPTMSEVLKDHMGQRTKRLGDDIVKHLTDKKIAADKALEIARAIAAVFGAVQTKGARIEQLAFVSADERQAALAIADKMAAGKKIDLEKEKILRTADTAADIAMFGRMLADRPEFNREAAVQVSHAITTHKVVVEDDFFTAMDDLSDPADEEGAGAAHLDVRQFGAGVFYVYACVDRDLLKSNLDGDAALAKTSLAALVRAAATVAPSGHQASFASRAYASFILAETGNQQPRSLVGAFVNPVHRNDYLIESVDRLSKFRAKLDAAYGQCWQTQAVMDVTGDEAKGRLADIITLAGGR